MSPVTSYLGVLDYVESPRLLLGGAELRGITLPLPSGCWIKVSNLASHIGVLDFAEYPLLSPRGVGTR